MNPPFTVDALHFNIKTTYVIIVINIKNNGLKSIYYDVYTVYYVNIMKKKTYGIIMTRPTGFQPIVFESVRARRHERRSSPCHEVLMVGKLQCRALSLVPWPKTMYGNQGNVTSLTRAQQVA